MIGQVDNGRTAHVDFYFYKGEVGVREYDGRMELAFFAKLLQIEVPAQGTLDGKPITISDKRVVRLDPSKPDDFNSLAVVTLIVFTKPQ